MFKQIVRGVGLSALTALSMLMMSCAGDASPKTAELARPLSSGPDAGTEYKAAMGQLQGKWTVVSRVVDGNHLDEAKLKTWRPIVIQGDQWLGPNNTKAFTFKIDPAKNPKQLDIQIGLNQNVLGIYKVEANTLTICQAVEYTERPKEFKAAPRMCLTVCKRFETP